MLTTEGEGQRRFPQQTLLQQVSSFLLERTMLGATGQRAIFVGWPYAPAEHGTSSEEQLHVPPTRQCLFVQSVN